MKKATSAQTFEDLKPDYTEDVVQKRFLEVTRRMLNMGKTYNLSDDDKPRAPQPKSVEKDIALACFLS